MAAEFTWETAPERLALADVYHQVAEVIGWDAAVDLGHWVWSNKRTPLYDLVHGRNAGHGRGRGVLQVPLKTDSAITQEVCRVIGEEKTKSLVYHLAGAHLGFPSLAKANADARDRAIVEQFKAGLSVRILEASFGLCERHIRRIVHGARAEIREAA